MAVGTCELCGRRVLIWRDEMDLHMQVWHNEKERLAAIDGLTNGQKEA